MNIGDQIQWEEVEAATSKMFSVWPGGGELAWAKECWGHLYQAGLTGNATVMEATASHPNSAAYGFITEGFRK